MRGGREGATTMQKCRSRKSGGGGGLQPGYIRNARGRKSGSKEITKAREASTRQVHGIYTE